MIPSPDPWALYGLMLQSRLFEQAIAALWREGLISGEMHLGTGQEAIVAGIVPQLRQGDALALDYRGTSALLMRGVDPLPILRELLGRPDGLCGGRGGHMHLFAREYLAASSGIVGAMGPTAAGFALAAQYLDPGAVAVAFFGEAAMNQGMLLESLNLAAAWSLPALFVCKDDGWGITTPSARVTGGHLLRRAEGLGVPALEVDGRDVLNVWPAAAAAIERARAGRGPSFLLARCVLLEAHFLGYPLLSTIRHPLRELPGLALPLARSFLSPAGCSPAGAPFRQRLAGLRIVLAAVLATLRDPRRDPDNDPLPRARRPLLSDPARLQVLEDRIEREVDALLASALEEVPS